MTVASFTKPSTLHRAHVLDLIKPGPEKYGTPLKREPQLFDPTDIEMTQHVATSADGAEVSYFVVGKGLVSCFPQPRPVLVYGLGCRHLFRPFPVHDSSAVGKTLTPSYSGVLGSSWLEHGWAYVQANIRGGGGALSCEDFEAVAEDLIQRGLTTKAMMGCMGGGSGGLLTANMLLRPKCNDLWECVVSEMPFADTGDAERCNSDIVKAVAVGGTGTGPAAGGGSRDLFCSPYHMVIKPGQKYPLSLFAADWGGAPLKYPATIIPTDGKQDDRARPTHARIMVTRLQELCDARDTRYYENVAGDGPSGTAGNKQKALMKTVEFSFLWEALVRNYYLAIAQSESESRAGA